MNKRGAGVLDNFGSMAIGIGALTITLIVAFLIMATAKTSMVTDGSACGTGFGLNTSGTGCCLTGATACDDDNWTAYNSLAYNSTGDLQNATSGIPSWVSIIVITSIGAALIGMVSMFRRN